MTAKIQNDDSYYQTFIKNGLHILPYAIAIIFIIQLAIQKIKFYFNAEWNECIGFIGLLLNCTIEDEIENSLNSHEGAHRENINADEYNISNFNNNMNKVDSCLDSSSNATNSTQDFDDSVSDIEILRGDSDDEMKNKKMGDITEQIAAKIINLQKKRSELCSRLLSYKLMEFQMDIPLHITSNTPNVPKPEPRQSESPLPVAEEIIFKVPSQPPHPKPPPLVADYEADMLAIAIQASLDDVASKLALDSNLTPPRKYSTFARLPGESSAESRKGISTGSAHSPGKISQKQSTPSRSNESNPLNPFEPLELPVVNFADMWDKNFPRDVEKEAEKPEARQEDSENVVMEDFMEGDRYVGDKGKRPLSGRYAYKKRSKPSKSESEEPGLSGSGDLPKKDCC